MTETEGKAHKAPGQRVQEEGKLATGRKGVQQKEVEDAKKLARPGYRGPAEEMQEGPGEVPIRREEPGKGGSRGSPLPNQRANKPLREPLEEPQERPAKERQGDPAGELQEGTSREDRRDKGIFR